MENAERQYPMQDVAFYRSTLRVEIGWFVGRRGAQVFVFDFVEELASSGEPVLRQAGSGQEHVAFLKFAFCFGLAAPVLL